MPHMEASGCIMGWQPITTSPDIFMSECIMGCQPMTTYPIFFNRLTSHFVKPFKAPCPLTQTSFCERLFPKTPGSSLPS